MQQLQHRTKFVSSLQCPSCNSRILCRQRCICNLPVLSCRLNYLTCYLTLKLNPWMQRASYTSVNSQAAKEKYLWCQRQSRQLKKCYTLLLILILLAFTWWQKVLPTGITPVLKLSEFKRSLIACKPSAFFVKWKSYLWEALLLTSLPQFIRNLAYEFLPA